MCLWSVLKYILLSVVVSCETKRSNSQLSLRCGTDMVWLCRTQDQLPSKLQTAQLSMAASHPQIKGTHASSPQPLRTILSEQLLKKRSQGYHQNYCGDLIKPRYALCHISYILLFRSCFDQFALFLLFPQDRVPGSGANGQWYSFQPTENGSCCHSVESHSRKGTSTTTYTQTKMWNFTIQLCFCQLICQIN